MSSTSINKQEAVSPLIVADDGNSPSKQGSEHGKDSGHASQAKAKAAVAEGGENLQPIDLMSPPSHAEDEEEAEPVYSEVAPEELLPPPDFKPFFTLVENPETGEHHHPSVHYVFYDDDQDILTDATLHAIDQGANSGEEAGGEERIVLLDMAPDGKTVESATSLSPKWQALKATVGQAPSWGDSSDGANKGLMLKISGQEVSDAVPQRHVKAKASSMDELVRSFGERLQGLDAVIGTEAAEDAAQ